MVTKKDVSDFGLAQVIDIRPEVLSSRELTEREKIVHEITRNERRPSEFLQAWKDGIALIGNGHFEILASSVPAATDKNQLRPDFDTMQSSIQGTSGGQRRFLIAMCQFYSDSGTVEFCKEHCIDMPSLADIALLDDRHRSVLIRLIDSYTGW